VSDSSAKAVSGTGAKHTISVDDREYEIAEQYLSGTQIKVLAGIASDYQLFLEAHGDDQPVADDSSVKIHSNMKFYALPPATFGR
jgi:hypothetical protein